MKITRDRNFGRIVAPFRDFQPDNGGCIRVLVNPSAALTTIEHTLRRVPQAMEIVQAEGGYNPNFQANLPWNASDIYVTFADGTYGAMPTQLVVRIS